MKRIATIAVDLLPLLPGGENGGAKIFTKALIHQLAEDHPDVRFVLVTNPDSHDELATLDRENVARLPMRPEKVRKTMWRRVCLALPRKGLLTSIYRQVYRLAVGRLSRRTVPLLKQVDADLLFSPFASAVLKEPSVPMVSVIYDLQHKTYPQFFPDEEIVHRDRILDDACRYGSVAVISDYVRDSVLRHKSIRPDRVVAIPIRLPYRFRGDDSPEPRHIVTELGIEPGSYLLYPANYWPHKNHEMLLLAFAAARRAGLPPEVKLVLTGAPGPREQELKRAASGLGLADDVRFLGYLTDHHFHALLRAAVGLVYPSLYEGFGMPVLEAMAAGCPVACSAAASLPEVAADAALMFDARKPDAIANAMIVLSTDLGRRDDLIARGRRRAAAYSDTRRMVDQYWSLFEGALAPSDVAVYGIHDDGWAGREIVVQVAPGASVRDVAIDWFVPKLVKFYAIGAEAIDARGTVVDRVRMRTRQRGTVLIPVGPEGGSLLLRFHRFLRLAEVFRSDDMRELTVLIPRVAIREDGAERVLVDHTQSVAGWR